MRSIRHRLLIWLLPGLGLLWGAAGTAIYHSVRHGLEARLDVELRNLIGPARFVARAQSFGAVPDQFRGSDFAAFEEPDGGAYFQIWSRASDPVQKSKSLASAEFPKPAEFSPHGVFGNTLLANGDTVRTLTARVPNNSPGRGGRKGGRFGPSRERPPFDRDNERPGAAPFGGPSRAGETGRGFRGDPDRGPDRGPDRDDGRRGPEYVNILIGKSRGDIDRTLGLLLGGITVSGLIAALASTLLIRFALQSGLKPLETVGEQASRIDAGSLQQRFPVDALPGELVPIAGRLNDLLDRMEESFERERRFSADLAHELRTPVAELKSMAEVAIKWPEQATPDNYQDVQDISDRMQAMIENLLMLARLENDRAKITSEPVRLRDLTESNWKPFAVKAADRQLSLNLSVGNDDSLETDPKLLGIIVTNLLSNAADYAPDNSAIKVNGTDSDIVFSVSNPAPDLKSGDLDHLFERLWRKDSSRSDDSHSGLGLALAKSCSDVLRLELTANLDEESNLTVQLRRRPVS
jgi:signal transduction histidine kinase